ncbi:MAG: hypothetical protein M3R63_10960 [Actinomycetota bacterium]|nr:hypothetical protein [Actinomycetota bacterium]
MTTEERERCRVVVEGRRTDNAELCTVVLVHEVGGTWAWYPHGANQLGVRLPRAEAAKAARAMLEGVGCVE